MGGPREGNRAGTTTDANMPTLSGSSVLWCRVTSDGTTVTVRCLAQSGEPSDGDWSGASDCYSSSNFDMTGGMIGFSCSNGIGSVDDVKVRSWNTSNSSFDIVEHGDTFSIDGSGNVSDTPTHDLAGNMTYDGSQKYAYDGWNRLATVAHAYRDGAGTLQSGQSFDTMSYDGKGRRIKKAIINTGQWDCAYKYYSDGDSVVESRDGSDNPIKQYVWGTRYVDELVQNSVVTTSAGPSYSYAHYWACQDSNYNVLGVIDSSGVLVERYQYTPYGKRTVFYSAGANDVGCYGSIMASRRRVSDDQPFGGPTAYDPIAICEIGHQGLLHDEESGIVYNRARHLQTTLGRFMQRDPTGYHDTMTLIQYESEDPVSVLDWSGLRNNSSPTSGGGGPPPAPGGPNVPIDGPNDAPVCKIAVRCYGINDNPSGPSHCGLILTTNAGVVSVDGTGPPPPWNSVQISPPNEPHKPENAGPARDMPPSTCDCILNKWQSLADLHVPYKGLSTNSNWSLKCVTKACNVPLEWSNGVTPWGWGSSWKCGKECPPL
ncbi:hypothetical protein BH09PLA1_BH09PLA1_12260 [soil metagenome]